MMNIKNHLQFKNSKIYPDNSHIRWEIDGKGFVGNKVVYQLINNNNGDSYFVFAKGVNTSDDYIEVSKIFWNAMEWIPGTDNWHHAARQSAMQWAENHLMNIVTNALEVA